MPAKAPPASSSTGCSWVANTAVVTQRVMQDVETSVLVETTSSTAPAITAPTPASIRSIGSSLTALAYASPDVVAITSAREAFTYVQLA